MLQRKALVDLIAIVVGLSFLVACAPAATPTVAPGPPPTVAPALPAPTVAAVPPLLTPVPTPTLSPAKPGPATAPAASRPKRGGIFLDRLWAIPAHFDLHQTGDGPPEYAAARVYSGLVQFDPEEATATVIVPDLAERWEFSPDGKTVTFYLRKGVKWHDGQDFTSQDAKFSVERMWKPPTGTLSTRKDLFVSLDKVEAPDAYTLKVYTKYPSPVILPALASSFSPMVPKHVVEKEGSLKQVMVGTGAFKLASYTPGLVLKYERNDSYFQPPWPFLDGISMFIIPDKSTAYAALYAEKVHTTRFSTGETVEDAEMIRKQRPDLQFQKTAKNTWGQIALNTRKSPFNDARVRRAISEAIDRKALVELSPVDGMIGGPMHPLGGWALPQEEMAKLPGFGPDIQARRARAKTLLEQAGYGNGFEAEIFVADTGGAVENALAARDQLAKIGVGVRLTVRVVPMAERNARRSEGRFDMTTATYGQILFDPSAGFGTHYVTGGGRNDPGYSNPKMDELYNLQDRTVDGEKRKQIVYEMQKLALEEAPYVSIFWPYEIHVSHPYLKGFVASPARFTSHSKPTRFWLDK